MRTLLWRSLFPIHPLCAGKLVNFFDGLINAHIFMVIHLFQYFLAFDISHNPSKQYKVLAFARKKLNANQI